MALLKTILVLILVYYTLKLLWRLLAPKLFGYAVKKAEERFGQQFGSFDDYSEPKQKQGETTISKRPPHKSNPSKKVGEYIDFEEIE